MDVIDCDDEEEDDDENDADSSTEMDAVSSRQTLCCSSLEDEDEEEDEEEDEAEAEESSMTVVVVASISNEYNLDLLNGLLRHVVVFLLLISHRLYFNLCCSSFLLFVLQFSVLRVCVSVYLV